MPYAEVIFEPGASSVLYFESEDELKGFLLEHNNRAIAGQPGAPQDQVERADLDPSDFAIMPSLDRMKSRPAERVSRVLIYENHPAELYNSRVSADTVNSLVAGMASDDGTIDHEQLVRALRDEASPVYPLDQGQHESLYKTEASGEMDLAFLESGAA